MAVYKVPQDVEAEDKLIGPFSFRQFIYLIVAALGIFLAWALSRIFIGLFILPVPIIVAMLALALPLRKDQPMETYLIAMLKFFFKPRHRLWDPEGTISLVEITAPKVVEGPQTKGFNADEASQRLSYLAQVVDTQGWSTRGAVSGNDSMSDIFVADASHAEDILDETASVSQAFSQKIAQADNAHLEAVRQQFQTATQQPADPVVSQAPSQDPVATPVMSPVAPAPIVDEAVPADVHFDPYPNSMHQHVLSPTGASPQPVQKPQAEPSETTVSPDILRLANNNDLSISALAREAHRLGDETEEVVISLR